MVVDFPLRSMISLTLGVKAWESSIQGCTQGSEKNVLEQRGFREISYLKEKDSRTGSEGHVPFISSSLFLVPVLWF